MKKADLKTYRERLIAIRARMRGDVNAMADVALRKDNGDNHSMPIHMAELGSDNYEQEFTLSVMQTEEDTLAAIEDALARVEEGNYGHCVDCEGVIPKTRLNAIPFTPVCVKCAEKAENN